MEPTYLAGILDAVGWVRDDGVAVQHRMATVWKQQAGVGFDQRDDDGHPVWLLYTSRPEVRAALAATVPHLRSTKIRSELSALLAAGTAPDEAPFEMDTECPECSVAGGHSAGCPVPEDGETRATFPTPRPPSPTRDEFAQVYGEPEGPRCRAADCANGALIDEFDSERSEGNTLCFEHAHPAVANVEHFLAAFDSNRTREELLAMTNDEFNAYHLAALREQPAGRRR